MLKKTDMGKVTVSNVLGRLSESLRTGRDAAQKQPGKYRVSCEQKNFLRLSKKERVQPGVFNVYERENWLV